MPFNHLIIRLNIIGFGKRGWTLSGDRGAQTRILKIRYKPWNKIRKSKTAGREGFDWHRLYKLISCVVSAITFLTSHVVCYRVSLYR